MFHRTATLLALLALGSNAVLAQGIVGHFKGTEKLVVANCGSYDGTSTNDWWATHSDLQGTSYRIKGGTSNGSFSGQGELDGSTASGKVNGVDKQGSAWFATFTSAVDGDKFTNRATGRVNGTSCTFVSEIEATRVP